MALPSHGYTPINPLSTSKAASEAAFLMTLVLSFVFVFEFLQMEWVIVYPYVRLEERLF